MQYSIAAIHGTGGRSSHFSPLRDSLRGVAKFHSVTLPGHSGPDAGDGVGTVYEAASRVALDIPTEPVVLGHSLGGIVALAMNYLGLIRPRAIILMDSNLPSSTEEMEKNRQKSLQATLPDWRERMVRGLQLSWPTEAGAQEWRERVFTDLAESPESSIRNLWSDGLTLNSLALWKAVDVPTLYVRATRAVRSNELALLTCDATLVEVSGGHWPHLTEVDCVSDAITKFLYGCAS